MEEEQHKRIGWFYPEIAFEARCSSVFLRLLQNQEPGGYVNSGGCVPGLPGNTLPLSSSVQGESEAAGGEAQRTHPPQPRRRPRGSDSKQVGHKGKPSLGDSQAQRPRSLAIKGPRKMRHGSSLWPCFPSSALSSPEPPSPTGWLM